MGFTTLVNHFKKCFYKNMKKVNNFVEITAFLISHKKFHKIYY